MKKVFLLIFAGFFLAPASGATFLERAQEALQAGKAQEAVTFLEAAVAQGQGSEQVYLYLGLAYTALGKTTQARRSFQLGAGLKGLSEPRFLFNLGVSAQTSGLWDEAEGAYSAVLNIEPDHQGALLNRGNLRLSTKKYPGALTDYETLLAVNPAHPQKPSLDQVIALLKTQVAKDEEQKALAEAARIAEEARKKAEAEEKAKAEEAARLAAEKAKAEEADRLAAEAAEKARLAEEARQAEMAKLKAEAEARRLAEEAEAKAREELLARIRANLESVKDEAQTLKAGDTGVETVEEDVPLAD